MKDKKTIKELFAEARRAKRDFGIAKNPEILKDIKNIVEKHGDFETAKEIGEQVDKLLGFHTREKILEILAKDHIYYSATRLSITALYDWEDIKNGLSKPCGWAVCRESDLIEPYKQTLHIPIDSFNTVEEAVDRFFYLYNLETGKN